jgi:hypothetical protein
MKIEFQDYKILFDAIQQVRRNYPEMTLDYYIKNNLGKDHEKRWRWDLLYAAKNFMPQHFVCDVLYKYLNNTHIDTALKKIVKEPVS